MISHERCDLSDRGWDPSEDSAANDEPEEREAEVDYVTADGKRLTAIVVLDPWGTEALSVSVFDEDDERVEVSADVVDAIVTKAVMG